MTNRSTHKGTPDDDLVGAALACVRRVSRETGHGAVEVFHRSSDSKRVVWDPSGDEVHERAGREQGAALRWFDPRRTTLGFAAASGHPAQSFSDCRSIARGVPVHGVEGCPWNASAEPVDDLQAASPLPGAGEMLDWLRSESPPGVESAWAEVSLTRESWLATEAGVQRRVRKRAWAAWTPAGGGGRPWFAAAAGWSALRRVDPSAAWRDRHLPEGREYPWPDDARLVFSPETSAILAHGLTRAVHRPGAPPGLPVGPGWVLHVDPAADPLFGSPTDDAGFPAESRILADGRRVVGEWGGPGGLRRGSFRDPPRSEPVGLSLSPPKIDPPHRAVWVTDIEIQPTGDTWIVRLLGRRYPDGAALQPRWVRSEPRRWLERCLGGLGPAFSGHLGLTTPTLVFDDLASFDVRTTQGGAKRVGRSALSGFPTVP